MKRAADAARMLRESNPVPDDAFAGAAGDSLGRATFDAIIDMSAEPAQTAGRSPGWRRPFWLAVVAAGVAVVAVAAAVLPGALLSGAGGPVAYAANVVKGVNSALTRADSGTFAQMTVTTSVAPITAGNPRAHGKTTTTTAEEWSYGDRWRSVTNSAAGRPVYAEGFGPSGYTLVSYPRRTWARQAEAGRPAGSSFGAPGCDRMSAAGPVLFQPSLPATGLAARSLLTVARTLRAAVACGTLDVAARQRFDGVEAIKLTSGRKSIIAETVWVSAGHVPADARGHPLAPRPLAGHRQGRGPPADGGLHLAAADHAEPGQAHRAHPRRIPARLLRPGRLADRAADAARAAAGRCPGLGYSGLHPGNLLPYRRPHKPS